MITEKVVVCGASRVWSLDLFFVLVKVGICGWEDGDGVQQC